MIPSNVGQVPFRKTKTAKSLQIIVRANDLIGNFYKNKVSTHSLVVGKLVSLRMGDLRSDLLVMESGGVNLDLQRFWVILGLNNGAGLSSDLK